MDNTNVILCLIGQHKCYPVPDWPACFTCSAEVLPPTFGDKNEDGDNDGDHEDEAGDGDADDADADAGQHPVARQRGDQLAVEIAIEDRRHQGAEGRAVPQGHRSAKNKNKNFKITFI